MSETTDVPDELVSRAMTGEPAAVGHVSASLCHLANICTRLRRTVEFDPQKEAITNAPDADAMLKRKYRAGHWAVPKGA